MNERPTPETDKMEWSWYEDCNPDDEMIVSADFARRLERELAEAREQAEKMRAGYIIAMDQLAQVRSDLRLAHEELKDWYNAARGAETIRKDCLITVNQLAQAQEELSQSHEQVAKMREAIKEAYRLLVAVDAGAQPDVEGLNWYDHRSQTIPKLQPFLDQ